MNQQGFASRGLVFPPRPCLFSLGPKASLGIKAVGTPAALVDESLCCVVLLCFLPSLCCWPFLKSLPGAAQGCEVVQPPAANNTKLVCYAWLGGSQVVQVWFNYFSITITPNVVPGVHGQRYLCRFPQLSKKKRSLNSSPSTLGFTKTKTDSIRVTLLHHLQATKV